MRTANRKRAGISGIIAALILFVMLFTIGTGYFLWINNNNSILSQAQANRVQSVQQQQLEDLVVTPAFCGSCGNHLTFSAKNTGSTAVDMIADFVDTAGSPVCTHSNSVNNGNGEVLNPGANSTSIDTLCTYTSGTTVTIKVLTQRGNVFSATYSGPGVGTSLSANPVILGQSVYDTATLSGVTPTAGGTLTYFSFSDGNCSGTGTQVSVVAVTNGLVPHSDSQTFSPAGSYSWDANYSGDADNPTALSLCEPLVVNQAIPSIVTSLSETTIGVGGEVSDSATLSGVTSTAGGTVQYEFFSNTGCTGLITNVGQAVLVTNGVVPDSPQQTFTDVGLYGWEAVYSGDGSNQPATSPCEPMLVQAVPTLSTALSQLSITVGGSVADNATLSGATTTASGTISFFYVQNIDECPTTSAIQVGSTLNVNGNGQYGPSASQKFSTAGVYYWYADYSGDEFDAGAVSPCEPLTVGLGLTTALSAPTIVLGSAVTDSATLQYAAGTSGSVTFYYFTGSTCSGTGTAEGTTPINNGSPSSFSSDSVTPASAGSYSWDAVYTVTGQSAPYPTSPCEQLVVIAPNGANVGSLSEVLGSFKFYFVDNCNSVENSSSMPNCLGDGVRAGGYYAYGLSFATQGSDCNSGGYGFFHFSSNPSCIPLAFSVRLTNTEPFRSITLGPQSFLWLDGTCQTYNDYFFFAGHCSGTNFFSSPLSQGYWIVQGPPTSSGDGAVVQPYSTNPADEVTIPPGGQATLYFYCGGPCTTSSSLLPPATNPPPGTYVEASLSLYGIYSDGTPFGQNIPFIASYVSPVQIVGCAIGSTYPNANSPCWTANTPNLAERPGATLTLAVNDFPCTAVTPGEGFFGPSSSCSSTDSFPIYANWVNSTGGITQIAENPDCSYFSQVVGVTGSEPPGYCTITFQIPSDTVPGDTYSMYVTSDGVNNAYLTVSMTGGSSTTISCLASNIDVGQKTTCTATVTGSSPTGTVTWSQAPTGIVSFSSTSCTLSAGSCSVTVTGSSAGTTTVTATYGGDINNQESSATLPFTVNPALSISISPSAPKIDSGQSITLTATASGGSGAYSAYQWYSNSACTATIVGATSSSYTTPVLTTTTTYCVEVTDSVGGTATQTVTVTVNSALTAGAITPSAPHIGSGESVTLTAHPSGGTTPYTYQWYTGASCTAPITGATGATYSASPSSTTTYYYEVTDSSSAGAESQCSAGDTVTVNGALSVSLSASPATVDQGQKSTLTATASGGSGTYSTYAFYSGSSCTGTALQSGSSNTYTTAALTTTTTFCVQVTDSVGGTATQTVTVTVNSALSVSISPSAPKIDSGQSITLTATASGGSGTYSTYTFYLTSCTGTQEQSGTSNTYTTPALTSTTTYCVKVTDSLGGTATATDTVTVNPALTAGAITPSAPKIDSGQSITLSASWSGGTSTFTVTWYSGSSATCSSDTTVVATNSGVSASPNTETVSPITTTYYCAVITDSSTGTPAQSVTDAAIKLTVNSALTAPGAPTVSATKLDVNQALTVTGTIPSTGTSTYSWQWLVSVNGGAYVDATQCATNSGSGAAAGATETCSIAANTLTVGDTYAFELQVTDSASTPETVTSAASPTVTVKSALTAPAAPTVSATTISPSQTLTVTGTIPSTGTSTYSWQWLVSVNGGAYVDATQCATNSGSGAAAGATETCSIAGGTLTAHDTYNFELEVTDSATTGETATSPASSTVTVT